MHALLSIRHGNWLGGLLPSFLGRGMGWWGAGWVWWVLCCNQVRAWGGRAGAGVISRQHPVRYLSVCLARAGRG